MIELIAVPFDGMGRARRAGQRAGRVTRRWILTQAFGSLQMARQIEVAVPAASSHRSATSGLLNEAALVAMVTQTAAHVQQVLNRQHFPVVYGGDCAVLLATVPSLAAATGSTGLLFLDGHEDATPVELSASGEAANMEIAILLGLTGRGLPAPLGSASGVLDPARLAVLGPRDAAYREPLGVGERCWSGVAAYRGRARRRPRRVCRRSRGGARRIYRQQLVAARRSRLRPVPQGVRLLRSRRRAGLARGVDLAATCRVRRDPAATAGMPRMEPRRLQPRPGRRRSRRTRRRGHDHTRRRFHQQPRDFLASGQFPPPHRRTRVRTSIGLRDMRRGHRPDRRRGAAVQRLISNRGRARSAAVYVAS